MPTGSFLCSSFARDTIAALPPDWGEAADADVGTSVRRFFGGVALGVGTVLLSPREVAVLGPVGMEPDWRLLA